jgi:hypothetical protein
MGMKDDIRFCDACGRTVGEGEKLVLAGGAWICEDCAASVTGKTTLPLSTSRSISSVLAKKARAESRKNRLYLRIVGLALIVWGGLVWGLGEIDYRQAMQQAEIEAKRALYHGVDVPDLTPTTASGEWYRAQASRLESEAQIMKAQIDMKTASMDARAKQLPWVVGAVLLGIAGIVCILLSFR